jgi:tRNA nucleotidyltransferase/poly(A) polymerase
MADYIYAMESRLTASQLQAVHLVQRVARELGSNLYLTGGAIRDILTGFPIRDLDFSVEGDPFEFTKVLQAAGATLNSRDEHLHELHLILPGNVRAEIAMARSEVYEKPGKAPTVTPATIVEDLRRRDFTVNAIALSLNAGSLGLLLDPTNGCADIELQQLRILHNYAFYEDPVRLIRATRFATRFGWEMDERSRARYDAAKENAYIEYLRKDSIGYEIEQIAHEEDPLAILEALDHEGWLKILHPKLSVAKADTASIQTLMKTRQRMWSSLISVDGAPAVMTFLTRKLAPADQTQIQKLLPHKEFVAAWKRIDAEGKELAKHLSGKEAALPSQSWELLSHANPEALLYLAVTGKQQAVIHRIESFLGEWREVFENLPAAEFAEARITPQVEKYLQIVHQVFLQLIDGKLKTHEEIQAFLEPYSPPLPPPVVTTRRRGGKLEHAKSKSVEVAPHAAEAEEPAPEAVETEKEAKAGKVDAKAEKAAAKAAAKAGKVAPAKNESKSKPAPETKPSVAAKTPKATEVPAKPKVAVESSKPKADSSSGKAKTAAGKAVAPKSAAKPVATGKTAPAKKAVTAAKSSKVAAAKPPAKTAERSTAKGTVKSAPMAKVAANSKALAKPTGKVQPKAPAKTGKPIAKAVAKPKSAAKPMAKQAVKALAKVAAKSSKAVAKPSSKVAAKPVAKAVAKTAAKPVSKVATQPKAAKGKAPAKSVKGKKH